MPLSRPETTPHPPVHGKTVFRETGPQKGWVPLSCSSLCSDTWRWSQIPQVRTQPHETAHHTHNLGHQSQVQLLTASYQLATSRRFPQPYPWVQLICEWGLQNSEEQFTYLITSLRQKDVTQEQPDKEVQRVRCGRGALSLSVRWSVRVFPRLPIYKPESSLNLIMT